MTLQRWCDYWGYIHPITPDTDNIVRIQVGEGHCTNDPWNESANGLYHLFDYRLLEDIEGTTIFRLVPR